MGFGFKGHTKLIMPRFQYELFYIMFSLKNMLVYIKKVMKL